MTVPRFHLAGTVLSTPDPQRLASFYEALLGWSRVMDEPDWVYVRAEGADHGLAFHTDVEYVAPTFPSRPGAQLQMLHLDFLTDDLDAGVAHALACGARLSEHQSGVSDERVLIDPDGHPFCLVFRSEW